MSARAAATPNNGHDNDPMEDTNNKAVNTTLSRSSLYAPLTAYESGTLRLAKNVAKAHAESSFIAFVQGSVSVDYHNACRPYHARNTGNRFLSYQEVHDKVLHRGLSLSKQYMMSPHQQSTTTTKDKQVTNNNNNHKHPTKRTPRQKKPKRSSRNGTTWLLLRDSLATTKEQVSFLRRLNALWTAYLHKLLDRLQKQSNNNKIDNNQQQLQQQPPSPNLLYQLMATDHQVEWIGARVDIDRCTAMTNRQGRQGILVSASTNTWTVVVDDTATTTTDAPPQLFQMRIPKRGTRLVVILHKLPNNDTSCDNNTGDDSATTTPDNSSVWRIRLNGDAA